MHVLYLLTRDLDATGAALRDAHARDHAVEVVDLRGDIEDARVVELVDAADRVICW